MYPLGTCVVSTYDSKIRGEVIGYGILQWPENRYTNGVPVYLVKISAGSSTFGPAVAVLNFTHTVLEEDVP